MNMQAIEHLKKSGKRVDAIEKKVVKHAVNQLQGSVDDEEAEMARVMAESKALYVSKYSVDYVGTRRKTAQSLHGASSRGAGQGPSQTGKA